MKKDWRLFISTITLAVLCLLAPAAGYGAGEKRDPQAVQLAQTMMKAMGGETAWGAAHFVRFNFIVTVNGKVVGNNAHLWDRKDGRYRFETVEKDGKRRVVLFTIAEYESSKKGEAFENGARLTGEAAQKAIEAAYASYINDTWWLSMPWKWLATGVNLKYLGPKRRGAENFDVVELTFNHVGLTPGDMYHAYVAKTSHLMTYWEYTLQSGDKGAWTWQYVTTGGIKLAKNHVSADHKASINMGNVRVLDAVDDTYFTDPAKTLAKLK